MINQQEISVAWLEKVSKENGKAVEKVIRALLLLEVLANSATPFQFLVPDVTTIGCK